MAITMDKSLACERVKHPSIHLYPLLMSLYNQRSLPFITSLKSYSLQFTAENNGCNEQISSQTFPPIHTRSILNIGEPPNAHPISLDPPIQSILSNSISGFSCLEVILIKPTDSLPG